MLIAIRRYQGNWEEIKTGFKLNSNPHRLCTQVLMFQGDIFVEYKHKPINLRDK